MSGYLLGVDALYEFIAGVDHSGKPSPIQKWMSAKHELFYISEFSWAQLRAMAEGTTDAIIRDKWLKKLDNEIPRKFGKQLVPVDRRVLERWSLYPAKDSHRNDIPVTESIEVATAVVLDLIYVSRGSYLAKHVSCSTDHP